MHRANCSEQGLITSKESSVTSEADWKVKYEKSMKQVTVVSDELLVSRTESLESAKRLATSKRISLATNCKIFKEKIVLRVENKIVGGFRSLKCVKMSLFITTFCRLTRCRMMNMTSKSDATAICVVESDNEYENSKSGCI